MGNVMKLIAGVATPAKTAAKKLTETADVEGTVKQKRHLSNDAKDGRPSFSWVCVFRQIIRNAAGLNEASVTNANTAAGAHENALLTMPMVYWSRKYA